jgi:GT2 family glycosyltransferase
MEAVAAGDPVAVYCAMEIREGDTVVGHVPKAGDTHLSGNILPGLTLTSFISTQTVIIRRDIYNQVGGFDETLSALVDWELMLRVAPLGDVAYVDTPLVDQFMSGNSITKSTKRRLAAQEYILEKHHDLMAQYPAALALHHHRIAGAHRQFGQFAEAAQHAAAAARVAPGSLKYRIGAVYTKLQSMVR